MLRVVVTALLVISVAGPSQGADEEADQPARIARTLLMVQDQIVHGSTAALESIPELRRRLAMAIERAPVSEWKEPRQGRVLVLHLLNGGGPQIVRKLLASGADVGPWRDTIQALLAYAERRPDAPQKLSGIDAMQLDPSFAGLFALVQAIAHSGAPEKARTYLSQAKLLSPGGLVEESAMRREIELLSNTGKKLEAAQVAARYLWRFGASRYNKDVVAFLARSLIPELSSLPDGNGAIAKITDELPASAKVQTLLTVARSALLQGRIAAADFAAGRAVDGASPGSPDLARAILYRAIARAFSEPTSDAVDKLRESDVGLLSEEDRAVLQASLAALARVRAPIKENAAVELSSTAALEAASKAIGAAQDQLKLKRP